MWPFTGLHFYVVNFFHLICSELLFQTATVSCLFRLLYPQKISHDLLLRIVNSQCSSFATNIFCSHLVPGTAMTAINVSFNSIITAYGLEHALAKRTIAVFGEFIMWFSLSLCVPSTCTVVAYVMCLSVFFIVCVCLGGGHRSMIILRILLCPQIYPFLWQKVGPILWSIYVVCQ